MPHVASFPLSASSFREGELAGLALLSRYPLREPQPVKFSNLGLRHERDGTVVTSYDKGLLSAVVDRNGASVRLVSLHVPPFHRFGRAPGEFESVWTELAKSIGSLRDDILYTDAFDLVSSKVIGTRSDHALCLAEFEPSPGT